MFELDHLFVLCEPGAPEADELVAAGLIEGPHYVHQGQGTSNRLFFFNEFYLEFLWVHDEAEARSSQTAPTKLWERWSQRQRGASSLGLCLRPSQPKFAAQKPFAGFEYQPYYLPTTDSIWIADQLIEAPMMFYLASSMAPKLFLASNLLNTQVQFDLNIESAVCDLFDMTLCMRHVQFRSGTSEKATLVLGEDAKREIRLPSLPLVIRY